MPDRYQPLRDAIAAGAVLVVLKRPEGYEDVHPEIMIDDAAIHPTFEPEHVGAELAALLREWDTLRNIVKDAEPILDMLLDDREEWLDERCPLTRGLIERVRAALADGEAQSCRTL